MFKNFVILASLFLSPFASALYEGDLVEVRCQVPSGSGRKVEISYGRLNTYRHLASAEGGGLLVSITHLAERREVAIENEKCAYASEASADLQTNAIRYKFTYRKLVKLCGVGSAIIGYTDLDDLKSALVEKDVETATTADGKIVKAWKDKVTDPSCVLTEE